MMVEIWSDVVCPWCAIGRSRLDAALADFTHADGVEVVLRSFELDPSAPVGGSQPMVEVLAEKYGVPREEAVRMMARTEGLAMLSRPTAGEKQSRRRRSACTIRELPMLIRAAVQSILMPINKVRLSLRDRYQAEAGNDHVC